MDCLTDERLKEIGAKYVFCVKNDIVVRDGKNPGSSVPGGIVPKYTIGWTDMEIKSAPSAAVIPFYVLNGVIIVRINAQLVDLILLEKL